MKKRLASIELLRIISMIMILTLHLMNFGNLLGVPYSDSKSKYIIVWLLEALSFVAVNSYILISGYFLVDSKFRFKKILQIWSETAFYSILINLILLAFNKITFSKRMLLKSCMPFLFNEYWFVTQYIVLYLLSPFLNKFVEKLNKKQYTYLILLIFTLFSIWPTLLTPVETLNFGGAYSISWFICLYIISGYIKKFYSVEYNKRHNGLFLVIYIISSLLTLIPKLVDIKCFETDFLYNYYSITVLIASVALFIFFKNIQINKKIIDKIILFFSSTTFGVYLIHENPLLRPILWNEFQKIANYSTIRFLLFVIVIPLILFIIFSIIDKIRQKLFNLAIKMKINSKIINKIQTNIKKWRKIYAKSKCGCSSI